MFSNLNVFKMLTTRGCSSFKKVVKKMCKENQCETHKAYCRGEEKPAVLDDRTGAIANHVFYVVIETVGTCNQREMRAMHQFVTIICVKIHSEQQRFRGKHHRNTLCYCVVSNLVYFTVIFSSPSWFLIIYCIHLNIKIIIFETAVSLLNHISPVYTSNKKEPLIFMDWVNEPLLKMNSA